MHYCTCISSFTVLPCLDCLVQLLLEEKIGLGSSEQDEKILFIVRFSSRTSNKGRENEKELYEHENNSSQIFTIWMEWMEVLHLALPFMYILEGDERWQSDASQ